MILQVLIAMMAGWINRHQQHVITYLKAENQVLKNKLPKQRLRFTDTERRRPAALAHPLGRKQLKDTATIATPNTLMRWYQRLLANKFDGSRRRKAQGRPRVDSVRSACWTSSSVSRRHVAPGVFFSPKSGQRYHASVYMVKTLYISID